MKRITALILGAILVLGCFAGCGGKKDEMVSKLPWAINEMNVEVIDDLPDWTGEEIDMTVWYCYGDHNPSIGKSKTDDKFHGEWKRVSGLSLNEQTSYDNAGSSADAMLAKMVSTKAYPHVAVGLDSSVLAQFVEGDKVYALDEYIEKWMPNYTSLINSTKRSKELYDTRTTINGKTYSIQTLNNVIYRYADPEYTDGKYDSGHGVDDSRCYVYVRDDILKKIRPEAHTAAELKEIYMKNGKFAPEEISDFTIKSLDEFKQLLVDIKALNIKENGKEVCPIYSADGTDNWSVLNVMLAMAGVGANSPNSYFVYYDNVEKKLKNPVNEQWFKDYVVFWNSLYREGLASEEAFIDTRAAFEQKVNNGEYAVLYGTTVPPSDEILAAGNKGYAYRKVYIDIPLDSKRFAIIDSKNILGNYGLVFFKDTVSEAQLEQILRWIDFTYTDAGMKFSAWGPQKAGLYAEDDKGFYFVDKKYEDAVVNGGDTQVLYDYGYKSFPLITHFIGDYEEHTNKFDPRVEYKKRGKERVASEYGSYFNFGFVEPLPERPFLQRPWYIYHMTAAVPGVKKMWNVRTSFEDALKKVLASRSNEEFEKNYNEVVKIQERNGYDDECFELMNKWLDDINGKNSTEELRTWDWTKK